MVEVVLIITLFIEAIIAYFLFDRDLIAPGFVFAVIFFVSALDILTMKDVWKYSIHWNTYFVISGGVLLFIIFSYIIKQERVESRDFRPISLNGDFSWEIEKGKLIIFLLVNILILVVVSVKTVNVVRANGFQGSFLWCIGKYSELVKFSQKYDLNIGKIASNLHQLAKAEAYVWGYLFSGILIYKKKINILVLLNLGATMLSYFINGSRTGGVFVVIALIPMILIFYRNKNKTNSIPRKFIMICGAIIILLFVSFQQMGAVISRTLEGTGFWEYIAIYLGAPIVNLDIFMQGSFAAPEVWGMTTFTSQLSYIFSKFGRTLPLIDLPFLSANGHNLGNVYTTFYAYVYDFGYLGVVFLVPLMAVIVQLVYNRAKLGQKHYYACLLYMFIFPTIAFSFFSNKFYEAFNIAFVKGLFWWVVVSWILMRMSFVRDNNFISLKGKKKSLRW